MNEQFVTVSNPKIRQKSDAVVAFDKSLDNLIDDLIRVSAAQTDPPALGMAAVQIGTAKRAFVAKIRNKFKPFVNARILKSSQKQGAFLEGCFSVPGIFGHVVRPLEVTVEAQDKRGKKITRTYKGLAARILQHEMDHLEGILFVDRVHEQNGKLFKVEKDKKGKEQLVAI